MNNGHILFFNFAMIFYVFSTIIYISNFFVKSNHLPYKFAVEYILMLIAFIFQLIFIVLRWVISGHAPMTSMFDYLNIFSFFIVISYIIMSQVYKIKTVGFIVNILILIIMVFASLFSREITPIIPALNSYWLGLHVSFAALGEGLFAISFIASFLYLIKVTKDSLASKLLLEFLLFIFIIIANITITQLILKTYSSPASLIGAIIYLLSIVRTKKLLINTIEKKLGSINLKLLDQLSYQSIAYGYPIFTLGALVFAMIWAEQAWGSYWSWDPKETWALISWLFYGLYLHLRLMKGWREQKTAWISVIGFVIILFTLLGVTYLMPGNHAYI